MAKGIDELIEFLLAEIALCGVQGAGSADFRRFIQKFHEENPSQTATPEAESSTRDSRKYYEKVWEWVRKHHDVRIVYQNEPRSLSLSEFEGLELQETGANGADYSQEQQSTPPDSTSQAVTGQASQSNFKVSVPKSLRQRLAAEGHITGNGVPTPKNPIPSSGPPKHIESSPGKRTCGDHATLQDTVLNGKSTTPEADTPLQNGNQDNTDPKKPNPRLSGIQSANASQRIETEPPSFDEIPTTTTAPRMYVSQDRTWQAVAGHSVDLKKLSAMQFALLSIIAAHGADGIIQPDLVKISGQDKRSVPHRTDELAKAGYIEKKPVQSSKLRTSLCVHKRFVKEGHFLKGPSNVEDVFRNRTVILSSLVGLLYDILKDVDFIPYSQLRPRLGVGIQEWTTRGLRSAIRRLEESGLIERKRALKKGSRKNTIVVIRLRRAPQDDDIKHLSFRRKAALQVPSEEMLDDDADEDDEKIVRDEDLVVDFDENEIVGNDRIPPQWTPDRLFPNLAFEAIELAGIDGTDAAGLRDRTMGKFWRRPTESYISRLTDNWELSQPRHLRHLALIRDTTVTNEKRLVHYVYRTHGNYQKAVDDKLAAWEVVSREAQKGGSKKAEEETALNQWGFPDPNMNDFHMKLGSSSISRCSAAVSGGRRHYRRWDNAFTEGLGYRKKGRPLGAKNLPKTKSPKVTPSSTPSAKSKAPKVSSKVSSKVIEEIQEETPESTTPAPQQSEPPPSRSTPIKSIPKRAPRQLAVPLLSAEQRLALNLPPRGRLGLHIENQIRQHREQTGDPTSLPDVIYKDPADAAKMKQDARTKENRKLKKKNAEPKIFTKAFREEHGLPLTGRLHQNVVDHYRKLYADGDGATPSKPPKTTAQTQPEPATPSRLDSAAPEAMQATTADEVPTEMVADSSPIGKKRKASVREKTQKAAKRLRVDTETPSADTHPIFDIRAGNTPNTDATSPSSLGRDGVETQPERSVSVSTHHNAGGLEKTPAAPIETLNDSVKSPEPVTEGTAGPSVVPATEATTRVSSELATDVTTRASSAALPSTDDPVQPTVELSVTSPAVRLTSPAVRTPKKNRSQNRPQNHRVGDAFTERSEPGVYVNPFATRPIPRGRPKKAFLVVVRSERMNNFEWFKRDPTPVASPKPTPSPRKSISRQTSMRIVSETPETPTAILSGREELELRKTPQNEVSSVRNSPAIEQQHDEPSQPPPQRSAWNAVNAPTTTQVEGNQGSYSANTVSQSPVLQSVGGSSIARTSSSQTPGRQVDSTPALSEAELRDLGYKRIPRPPKRGVRLGDGYVWRLRTVIVHDILKRCHGVFPFNGEIVAPFLTLWDERAPKMSKPDRTTITATVNSMIEDSRHSIRKITFRMPNVDGTSTVEKYLIALASVSTTDPKITELQLEMTKAYPKKYYPEEIRALVGPEPEQRKPPEPEFDDTISIESVKDNAVRKLDRRILSAAEIRRLQSEKIAQRKARAMEKRKKRNMEAELLSTEGPDKGIRRRNRLETLNGNAQSRFGKTAGVHPRLLSKAVRESSPAPSSASVVTISSGSDWSSSEDEIGSKFDSAAATEETSDEGFINVGLSDFELTRDARSCRRRVATKSFKSAIASASLMAPGVHFHPNTGTFSTEFGAHSNAEAIRQSDTTAGGSPTFVVSNYAPDTEWTFVMERVSEKKKRKRVRFEDNQAGRPQKKRRLSKQDSKLVARTDSEGNPIPKKHRGPYSRKWAQQGTPTVVERLTGLTGDPNDPLYTMPQKKRSRTSKPWMAKKPVTQKKEPAPRKVVQNLDAPERFKKIVCTLTIASCMSAEENVVDWSIVAKVYKSDAHFELEKTKKLWSWIQKHMAAQLRALTASFQSSFLAAYENGIIASIEDPETYDWEDLVRWALRTCDYPEAALPGHPDALCDYIVAESQHTAFNRTAWVAQSLAQVVRGMRLLKYGYASPLHNSSKPAPMDLVLRARSWVRSNTATAQRLYDSNAAHDKLKRLGNTMLERVVADMIYQKMIRQRKIKRLLPGRNFDFTSTFALRYRRPLEQSVFIDAVNLKKSMDSVFANRDPEQRVFVISRTANDGAVMALLSLVNDGRVKLVPMLPPVNNELRAPSPRLSVWGFKDGEYSNRKTDRKHFFWDIQAVPTSTYQFGNPLQPSPEPPAPGRPAEWLPLPEPPLPGKEDPEAALPIWSSIDGKKVTWPWWYRILNIVLQAFEFQPGATAAEIHRHCPAGTAELFEVELILNWLVSANAAVKVGKDTFRGKEGFWAVFGETLFEEENDWFGDHVKRRNVALNRQPWRLQHNVRPEEIPREGGGNEVGRFSGHLVYGENHLQRLNRKSQRQKEIESVKGVSGVGYMPARDEQGDIEMGDVDHDAVAFADMDDDMDEEREQDVDAEGESDDDLP